MENSSTIRPARRRRWLSPLILMVVAATAAWQSQSIIDWVRLRGYEPPAAIAAIAEQTAMSDTGKHLFYINRPALQDKQAFRESCPNYEATIVIGCYREGQQGIFVLKVDDPRLAGVEQVTSAHEMLHAAYSRLNRRERAEIGNWLQTFASEQLQDARIKATLKNYEVTEPGQQNNEMFAIFGTELSQLTPELERVYSRYFTNRQAVVAYANKYQAAFTSRQEQIKRYDAQLNSLDAQVKRNTAQLNSKRASLDAADNQLEADRRSGNAAAYNAGVARYNQQVNEYNELLTQTRAMIAQYNRLVKERNAIADETNVLRDAIDSSSLPASQ